MMRVLLKGSVAAVIGSQRSHWWSGRRASVPVWKEHLDEAPMASAVTVGNGKCVEAEVILVGRSFSDRVTSTVDRV